jgi:hypothetical protein
MGKYAGDSSSFRHRFSVPSEDVIVEEWIAKQANLSSSVRVLIRNFVRDYGNRDATCVEFGVPARRAGRPAKNDSLRFLVPAEYIPEGEAEDDADQASGMAPAPVQQPAAQPSVQVKKPEQEKPKAATPSPMDFMNIDYGSDAASGAAEEPGMDPESADVLAELFGQRPDNGR